MIKIDEWLHSTAYGILVSKKNEVWEPSIPFEIPLLSSFRKVLTMNQFEVESEGEMCCLNWVGWKSYNWLEKLKFLERQLQIQAMQTSLNCQILDENRIRIIHSNGCFLLENYLIKPDPEEKSEDAFCLTLELNDLIRA